jgi:addiction module HigA family antidote
MAARKIELSHPGRILREEFMEPAGLSAYAPARALAVPLPRVNDIVREKRSVSPEMAREKVGKQAARISPHPHAADGSLRPV